MPHGGPGHAKATNRTGSRALGTLRLSSLLSPPPPPSPPPPRNPTTATQVSPLSLSMLSLSTSVAL
ncbi:hypothetical protein BVC80_9101g67 [Macleaya cordata]|uniref:Uncharacterized protein n=1 Tax=Macleaya cordata TaxID=56857 RepID=A0A200QGL0_MACCD|nr:hypothetical protein BVC80_9101g67 [Macleaya cordata]